MYGNNVVIKSFVVERMRRSSVACVCVSGRASVSQWRSVVSGCGCGSGK